MTVEPSQKAAKKPSPLSSHELATIAIEAAIDQKAHDVCGLDISSVSDVADFFVLASGTSDRHVQGIADKIKDKLKPRGETALSQDGYENSEWIILDYANVVIHVFFEPMRHHYNLDELWSAARQIILNPELEQQAKKSRTGLVSQ